MFGKIKKFRRHFFWSIFLEKNGLIFFFNFLSNFLASVIEGLSFGSILLAFTVINGNFVLPPSFSWFHFLKRLSNQDLFVFFIVGAVFLQAFRSSFTYLAQFFSSKATLNIQMLAQRKIYEQFLRMSFSCVSRYKVGDLVKYVETPSVFLPPVINSCNGMIVSFFMIMIYLVIMLFISPLLTFITGGLFCLFVFFQKVIIKKMSLISTNLTTAITDLSKDTVQNLHGMRFLHTYGRQKLVLEKIKKTLDQIVFQSKKLNLWNTSITSINEMGGISLVGVLLILGAFFLGGKPTFLPFLLTFITITYRFSLKVQAVMGCAGTIAMYFGSIVRLKEILSDEDKEYISLEGKKFLGFKKDIAFQNISLSYFKNHKKAVDDFSFLIQKGMTTALVGPSGAGKSSIADLLLRLYEPVSGEILIDGISLKEYGLNSWREKLGVVSQDTFIFNDSIEENIRLGVLEATKEEIIEAAKLAHAHEFISQLPQGYKTIVGERGYRLSGGERQRIALARVFLRDPEIIILDEATSHLDSHSESLIQEALENLKGKKTMIIIAHRLATIFHADQILFLDRGCLIEKGTHKSLLDLQGRYSRFWNLQSGIFSDKKKEAYLSL